MAWDYSPSVAAGVITAVIFGILTVTHIVLLFRSRTWFCVPLVIGGIFETVGYAARAVGHRDLDSLPPYIMQALLILLAPILFAASVYMFLGRIIRATGGEKYSIVRVTWVTKVFVGGDILCFLVQAVGAAILANADSKDDKNRGENIILAGLVLQILIFGFFLLVALIFHKRLRAKPTNKAFGGTFNWERYMLMLHVVSVLITVRNVFRVIEYAMGEDGYLLQNEWPIYVFDAILMIIALGICSLWYVGRLSQAAEENEMMVMND